MPPGFRKETERKKRGRCKHVHGEKGTGSEYDVSNAEIPGTRNGWGVCMDVFAPEQIAVNQRESHCAREMKYASGFFCAWNGRVRRLKKKEPGMRVEDRT